MDGSDAEHGGAMVSANAVQGAGEIVTCDGCGDPATTTVIADVHACERCAAALQLTWYLRTQEMDDLLMLVIEAMLQVTNLVDSVPDPTLSHAVDAVNEAVVAMRDVAKPWRVRRPRLLAAPTLRGNPHGVVGG